MFVRLFNNKRVPNFISELFVLFAVSICCADDDNNFEIKSSGTNLLHWEGRNISYWDNKILYNNRKNFETEVNFLKVNSNVRWLNTDLFKINYSARFDFDVVKPSITAGYLNMSDVEILSGDTEITNGGAKGFYVNSAVKFNIRDFEITPSFMFAKGKFEDGSWHFFYGKPDIPKFLNFGLAAEYKNKHKLDLLYNRFAANIINNNEMPLLDSENYILAGNYKYLFPTFKKVREFYGILGFAYADIFVDGSLTPANQQYFLFPYAFYNNTISANAFAGWTGVSFDIQRKHLKHLLKFGTAYVFTGEINADKHYKYRKFFGKDEHIEKIDAIDLSKTLVPFASYLLESPGINIKDKVNIYFDIQKILATVFGDSIMFEYKEIWTDAPSPPPEDDPPGNDTTSKGKKRSIFGDMSNKEIFKTALFSGWSFSLRITF